MSWIGTAIAYVVERQAGGKTVDELIAKLAASGAAVAERMARAADTPGNRDVAAHIIGIERWGAQRLRTALGDVALADEYDGYRPGMEQDMAAMAEAFAEAREQTIALAHQAANLPSSVTARHNDLGDLSVKGWLGYLGSHATRELRRLRS